MARPKTSFSFLMDCTLGFIMMRMKRRVMMTWEKKVRGARRRKIRAVGDMAVAAKTKTE